MTLARIVFDFFLWGPVITAKHIGPFEKSVLFYPLKKFFFAEKDIIMPVFFFGTRMAGRAGNGLDQIFIFPQKFAGQRGFAGTGRRRNNKKTALAFLHDAHAQTFFFTFWKVW